LLNDLSRPFESPASSPARLTAKVNFFTPISPNRKIKVC